MNHENGPGAAGPGNDPAASNEFASYVFLLGAEGIRLLPHGLYVALARGEAACTEVAGRSFRLADWYVRVKDGQPLEVVREWYGWVRFDCDGRFDPVAYRSEPEPGNIDPTALPGPAELRTLHELVFLPPPPS